MVNILEINIALVPTLHNDMLIIKTELQLETSSIEVNYILGTYLVISADVNLPLCRILFIGIPYDNLDEAFE